MLLKRCLSTCFIFAALLAVTTAPVQSRALFENFSRPGTDGYLKPMVGQPNTQFDAHSIGKMKLAITNFGTFGYGYITAPVLDGEPLLGCEYPINSDLDYLFSGAIWVGAVIGRDTLVSVGGDGWFQISELFPDAGDAGAMIEMSNIKSKPNFSTEALSEQDFICTFTDTFTDPGLAAIDPFDNRPHSPLHISIQQNSYAWSYDYAEDFVIFDYKLKNIGQFPIRNLYLAIYVDADVYHTSLATTGFSDDICGFKRTVPMPSEYCIDEDTVNIAWIADNDGDPSVDGGWSYTSPVGVTGVRVVRTPNEDLKYSFNWWISNGNAALDFGPRLVGTDADPFRTFGGGILGTPTGDRNKYYVMSHEEFDYDQLFTAISHTSEGYMPPPQPARALDFANGFDTRYLLSFGPFDVPSDSTLPITIAYVAGDNFHVNDRDFADYFNATVPSRFYERLNFDDLGTNARWASWIFDNPGVDTDEDGDSGKFCWDFVWDDTTIYIPGDSFIVDYSKIYYGGHGVPDFRGASPPPPPVIKVMPSFGSVTIRWNGQETENSLDVFSRQKDFEGYRVYYSEGNQLSDFVSLTSYDVDDYKVYEFNPILLTWDQISLPITKDSLQILYGESFDPETYHNEFTYFTDPITTRLYYFAPQDWNQSDLSNPLLIHKVYPNSSKTDSSDTTSDGWLRFYEYEYTIDNLLPSKPYYFSVTAFDFGSLKVDLGALESSPLVNAIQEYPLPTSDEVENNALEVLVYPNPYRIDGGYADAGYENRDRSKTAERTRAINFANLPRVCKIRIYTLNGDLVQEIDHYKPDGGPRSQHEEWDVISKNTQAVVTGIYLWHVESDMGDQIGKLVIIK